MNKAIIIGRLVKDPEVRYSNGENAMCIARFTLAVDRKKKDDGADFIPCVAFGKTAEFVEKYFKKGTKAVVDGRIQTGSYTNKEGQKVYTTDIAVEAVEFAESKASGEKTEPKADNDGWQSMMEVVEEDSELPFAMPSR